MFQNYLTYLYMKINQFLFMYFKSIILIYYQLSMFMGDKKQ